MPTPSPPSPVLFDAVACLVLYTGLGCLLSRFLTSKVRNFPLTWLFLTVVFLPVVLSFLSLLFPVTATSLLWFSTVCLIGAYVLSARGSRRLPQFTLLEEQRRIHPVEIAFLTLILLGFLYAALVPKLSLLRSNGVAIWDDFNNIRKVLSVSFDVATPKYFYFPSENLSYYYYDFMLPGILHRATSLTLQQALFIHNVLEYVAILSFFLYVASFLFKKGTARLTFILACTFMGGGLEYFLFHLLGADASQGMGWWLYDLFGIRAQITSFYALFIWVPHHLMAGVAFAFALLLTRESHRVLNRLLIPVVFAAILGLSSFVFITASISFFLAEVIVIVRREEASPREWKWLSVQAVVFLILAWKLVPMYAGRKGAIFPSTLRFTFLDTGVPEHPMWGDLMLSRLHDVGNFLFTNAFIYAVDIGVVFFLALLYFCGSREKKPVWAQRQWPLDVYLLSAVVTCAVVLSHWASIVNNDFFMRGMIVAQISMAIAAAFAVEAGYLQLPAVLIVIPVMFLLELTSFTTEYQARKWYEIRPVVAPYDYILRETPKDAVIFLDNGHTPLYECEGVTFQGNRVCYFNTNEIGEWEGQYVKLPEDLADYHTLERALAMKQFPHRYYISSKEIQHAGLKLVHTGEMPEVPDQKAYIYEIGE